jgi:electron-transferring-flavoprotein dehydrogenase
LDSFISRGREPWTLTNKTKDSQRTLPAKLFKEISYPKADGIISFDLLTSLSRSGTSRKK